MSEVTAEEVADVLDRASDEILVHGWGQGMPENPYRRSSAENLCVQEAIAEALGEGRNRWNHMAQCAVGAVVRDVLRAQTGVTDLFMWNDRETTTEDDIHDTLRTVAKGLRNGEIQVP